MVASEVKQLQMYWSTPPDPSIYFLISDTNFKLKGGLFLLRYSTLQIIKKLQRFIWLGNIK